MARNRPTALTFLLVAACGALEAQPRIDPSRLRRMASTDERFQSYNVEMVEVTGGRFWKPYRDIGRLLDPRPANTAGRGGGAPAGLDPNLFQQRPPIDLSNARLRRLAAALGPAYIRVSGTWANSTWFDDSGRSTPQAPPKGFGGVLTRGEWKGVVDFARAVDAKLVTSFAMSGGTRDASGAWAPDQARRFVDYTKALGGSIAAAEFMNEPTFARIGGAPEGYDAAAYARDLRVFLPFIRQASPRTVILGPGGVGEGVELGGGALRVISSEDILKATGPVFDAISYHSYGAVSRRCSAPGATSQVTAQSALSADYLSRSLTIEQFYASLRDRFEPGKPLWLTETADAACGGNPWAATFLDTFRYLNQMASLARRGVQVHMHNTLASSDYGLLDDENFLPRPNYWGALMWRKLIGATVLDAGRSPSGDLHLYAHCLRGKAGGVAVLAINAGRIASEIQTPVASERYTLGAPQLESRTVQLNGAELKLGTGDSLPELKGAATPAGTIRFAPETITFLAIPAAGNKSCR